MDGAGGDLHTDPTARATGYSPGPEPSLGTDTAGALRGGSPRLPPAPRSLVSQAGEERSPSKHGALGAPACSSSTC